MILFIRDKKNNTILDAELTIKWHEDNKKDNKKENKNPDNYYVELSSLVCIEPYSRLLLSTPEEEREEIIATFDALQELRGWLWESYFMNKKNTSDEYDNVLKELRTMLKGVAEKYDLYYVED